MSDRKTHLGAGALVGIGVGVYSVRNLEGWPVVARMLGAVLASVALRRVAGRFGAGAPLMAPTLVPQLGSARWHCRRDLGSAAGCASMDGGTGGGSAQLPRGA